MSSDTQQIVQKQIIVKIDFDDIPSIRVYLKRIQEQNPQMQYGSVRVGRLGDDVLLSFTIDSRFYKLMMEKLDSVGAKSLLMEKNILEKANQAQIKVEQHKQQRSAKAEENKNTEKHPQESLKTIIESGDFETLIKISKNLKSGFEMIKKAKENLDRTIENAINLSFNKAVNNKFFFEESFARLIKISSNKELRAMNKIDLLTAAGLKAVALCQNSADYINRLVAVANNNLLPNIVVVIAAVKFSEFIFNDPSKYEYEFQHAVKYLNTRWVIIARDVVFNKLTQSEKQNLQNLIEYIEKTR